MDYFRIIFAFTFLPFLTVCGQSFGEAEEACCLRHIIVVPIEVPEGQGISRFVLETNLFEKVQPKALEDCPLRVETSFQPLSRKREWTSDNWEKIIKAWDDALKKAIKKGVATPTIPDEFIKIDPHYLLQGHLTVQETGREYGDIVGNWTLEMKINDAIRGDTVDSGICSWSGRDYNGQEQVGELGVRLLGSIDDVIYRYEGMPKSAVLEPEKKTVPPGKQIGIQLTNIRASQGDPKPWQQVLVTAEKGKILNGAENGNYRRFDVGGGTVDIRYLAPKECKTTTDKITVFNSCEQNPPNYPNISPAEVIAQGEVEIECSGEGSVEVWALPKIKFCTSEDRIRNISTLINQTPIVVSFQFAPIDNDPCFYEVIQTASSPGHFVVKEEKYDGSTGRLECIMNRDFLGEGTITVGTGTVILGGDMVDVLEDITKPLSFFIMYKPFEERCTCTYVDPDCDCRCCCYLPSIHHHWGSGGRYYPLADGYINYFGEDSTGTRCWLENSASWERLHIDEEKVKKMREACNNYLNQQLSHEIIK